MAPWRLLWPNLSIWAVILAIFAAISIFSLVRALTVSQNTHIPKYRPKDTPTHVLIVLGSGGHTAEMFSMLRRMRLDPSIYTHRTYVVSAGDNFSASKAVEFEQSRSNGKQVPGKPENQTKNDSKDLDAQSCYTIVTVPRARRVHQSYLTAPFSTLYCLWACLLVLRGMHPAQNLPHRSSSPYPDIILANGPATAVCVVLAARILRFLHSLAAHLPLGRSPEAEDAKPGENGKVHHFQLRTIFVESWARVTTLSLSGKLLLPFVDRFLVQWPGLEGKMAWRGMRRTEYVGALVD